MIKYSTKKETPNRKMRKSARNTTFMKNRKETKLRREARKELKNG